MNMIKADKENNIFGALKLIEQLYLDGEIPGHVFRNILQEYKDDIEAPLSCIEYVVTHEFVHFLQPNHSRKFYQYLSMFMPDWKERKSSLEKTYNYFE